MIDYIQYLLQTINNIEQESLDSVVNLIREVRDQKGTIWICGNGGAAATANHFQNDLIKMCGIKAISLCSNVETILAYGNDCSFEDVFKKQLEVLYRPRDLVILLSTSGTSKNLDLPKEYTTLGIFGNAYKEGRIECTHYLEIYSTNTQITEDMHSILMHMIVRRIAHFE